MSSSSSNSHSIIQKNRLPDTLQSLQTYHPIQSPAARLRELAHACETLGNPRMGCLRRLFFR